MESLYLVLRNKLLDKVNKITQVFESLAPEGLMISALDIVVLLVLLSISCGLLVI